MFQMYKKICEHIKHKNIEEHTRGLEQINLHDPKEIAAHKSSTE